MAEDYTHLITNPWAALDSERKRHAETLEILRAAIGRSATLDGRSAVSITICKLCQDIPQGHGLKYRATCPLHNSVDWLNVESARLKKPYRRQQAQQAEAQATAAQTDAPQTPSPTDA